MDTRTHFPHPPCTCVVLSIRLILTKCVILQGRVSQFFHICELFYIFLKIHSISKHPDSKTPNRSWKGKPLCLKEKLAVKMNFKRIKRTHEISQAIDISESTKPREKNVYGWSNSTVEKSTKNKAWNTRRDGKMNVVELEHQTVQNGVNLSHKEIALSVQTDLNGKCQMLYTLVLSVAGLVVSDPATIKASSCGLKPQCRWESEERISSRDSEINWELYVESNFQFWWSRHLL